MSDFEFIPPQTGPLVSFSLEPAYNLLCSLMLLNEDLSGFGDWVGRTLAALTADQLQTNEMVSYQATVYLAGVAWPSFPAWVDDIAQRDPYEIRDRSIAFFLDGIGDKLGLTANELPSPEELIADRDTYLGLVERSYRQKGLPCDRPCHQREHDFLQDPVAHQQRIVRHLREMWEGHLAREWGRNLPMLRESVAAFQSIDYGGNPVTEMLPEITARDQVPRTWEAWLPETEHFIFIPSAHIGPYLLVIDRTGTTARIVFGARIPQGATVVSPALSRSELLMRLGALADDTRLRILELLAREGELSAQDVIVRLDISQSSASRHLRQLSATGYLVERRQEGAKIYRLNPKRLDDTLGDLKRFLH
jgi:DNA-binding transcriptional ArsR family regulator